MNWNFHSSIIDASPLASPDHAFVIPQCVRCGAAWWSIAPSIEVCFSCGSEEVIRQPVSMVAHVSSDVGHLENRGESCDVVIELVEGPSCVVSVTTSEINHFERGTIVELYIDGDGDRGNEIQIRPLEAIA